ncbi:nucleotide exchange factor GrpE [Lacrimispora saccharolytica]|uniref:nucleotide exchange factor GrpE n=1 Tax=Lacrimispora saccharolytica TaxID=84030 RepID=UPI00265D0218|nr:nucleotide exchange factor GrpE [Lacrimispora saccharolytica]MCF2656455.1 nucleotide exchange factor GrpE [Lacrimispora saccharolytica]
MAENTEEILDEDKMNNPGKDDEVEADNTADTTEVNEAETDADASVSDAPSEEAADTDAKDEKCSCKKGRKDKKLDALESKNAELEDRVKRQMAEFENFRKRTEKEKSTMFDMGARSVIEKLLPVVDNFERGLASITEEQRGPVYDGMNMIYKQLMDELDKMDVKPIEALGQPFDPNLHNAVMQVESEEFESGVVAQELQKGYTHHGSVVRHSMVSVVK